MIDVLDQNISFVDPHKCYEKSTLDDRLGSQPVPVEILQKIGVYIKETFSDIIGCPFVLVGVRGWVSLLDSDR